MYMRFLGFFALKFYHVLPQGLGDRRIAHAVDTNAGGLDRGGVPSH